METFDEPYKNLLDVPRRHMHANLLGFEALHLLYPGKTISPKILRAKCGIKNWSGLVETGDIVVCSGLGEAIVPRHMNEKKLCDYAMQAISGQDILVCPIYLLNQIFEENSCKRNDLKQVSNRKPYAEKAGPEGYQWVVTNNPFQCAGGPRHLNLN